MTSDLLAAIRQWLIDQGVAGPVYLQYRPPNAGDVCLLLRDYGDVHSPPFLLDARLQVVSRGPRGDVKAAKDLAESVHGVIWPPASEVPVLELWAAGRSWVIGIEHLSGPLDLGPDDTGRFEFSTNYRLYAIKH